jgi:hypothetical protein
LSRGARRELNIFYSPAFPTFPTFPTSLPKVGSLKVEEGRKSFKLLCKSKEKQHRVVKLKINDFCKVRKVGKVFINFLKIFYDVSIY